MSVSIVSSVDLFVDSEVLRIVDKNVNITFLRGSDVNEKCKDEIAEIERCVSDMKVSNLAPKYVCSSEYYMSMSGSVICDYELYLSVIMPLRNVLNRLLKIQEDVYLGKPLYLLCVKYIDEKGGDIQLGITESHRSKSELDVECARRGLIEECQICVDNKYFEHYDDLDQRVKRCSNACFFLDVNKSVYKLSQPRFNSKRINGRKSCVYVYGTYDNMITILNGFNPENSVTKNDDISNLVLMPFSEFNGIMEYNMKYPRLGKTWMRREI